MPDRDKGAQQARNKRTLLVARTPDGFPQQVKAEADARGTTVSAFVVGAVTREMQGPDGGKTAPATGERGNTSRKPRPAKSAPPVILREPARPSHSPTCKCLTCKPKTTKPEEGKR